MIEAAKRGESLHKLAAARLFGKDYSPDQYKLAKNINFTWAFGGGAGKMSRQYEIDMEQAQALIRDYENAFPALVRFKREQQNRVLQVALGSDFRKYRDLRSRMYEFRADTAEGRRARAVVGIEMKRLCRGRYGFAETPFGRRIIVDAEKPYTVVNYTVQSSARDIMGEALLRVMSDPELEPWALLPIHDEILGQAPSEQAEELAQRYGEVMSTDFLGVPITASGKVYGKSWGHGYGIK